MVPGERRLGTPAVPETDQLSGIFGFSVFWDLLSFAMPLVEKHSLVGTWRNQDLVSWASSGEQASVSLAGVSAACSC